MNDLESSLIDSDSKQIMQKFFKNFGNEKFKNNFIFYLYLSNPRFKPASSADFFFFLKDFYHIKYSLVNLLIVFSYFLTPSRTYNKMAPPPCLFNPFNIIFLNNKTSIFRKSVQKKFLHCLIQSELNWIKFGLKQVSMKTLKVKMAVKKAHWKYRNSYLL